MKLNQMNTIIVSASLTAALFLGLTATVSAGEGDVIATCKLTSASVIQMSGRTSKSSELSWQVADKTDKYPGLQSIRDRASTHRYVVATRPGKTAAITGVLQNAKSPVIAKISLLNRRDIRVKGRTITMGDMSVVKRRNDNRQLAYGLVKKQGKIRIVHLKSAPLDQNLPRLAYNDIPAQ